MARCILGESELFYTTTTTTTTLLYRGKMQIKAFTFLALKFSIYLDRLQFLLLCFFQSCYWEAVRPCAPEQQQQQRKAVHTGLCLPS